jgi:hypothetical protein
MIHDHAREGDAIRKLAMERIDRFGVFTDMEKFKKIKNHSSRSVASNF